MNKTLIPSIITTTAVVLIIVHILFPHLAIDSTSLGLIVIAITPWLSPLFKSLEFPGGLKVEYQDLEKTEKQIQKAGLLPKSSVKKMIKKEFLPSTMEDPNLALAWLRIEVEKRLRELAQKKGLSNEHNIHDLLFMLYANDVINDEEREALVDVTAILNKSMQGVEVEPTVTDWTIEVGPRLLKGLENKLTKK